MDQGAFLGLLRQLCEVYAQDKRGVPELDLILDAYEAGGAIAVDLPTRAIELDTTPSRLARRLARLTNAGVHFHPSSPTQSAKVVLLSHARAEGGARGGAGGGSARAARGGARARVADGGTRAPGVCSVLNGSVLFGSLRAGVARVPLFAYADEEKSERLERATEVLHRVGTQIPSTDLPAVARAVYCAETYLGGSEVFDDVLSAAIEKGPDLSSGWEGWAAHIRKNPADYLTRLTFVNHSQKFAPSPLLTVKNEDSEESPTWAKQCEAIPQLRTLQAVFETRLGRDVWSAWGPLATWRIEGDQLKAIAPLPYWAEYVEREFFDVLQECAQMMKLKGVQIVESR